MGVSKGKLVSSKYNCARADGRNLAREWLLQKAALGYNASYAANTRDLRAVDPLKTDYLMGESNTTTISNKTL